MTAEYVQAAAAFDGDNGRAGAAEFFVYPASGKAQSAFDDNVCRQPDVLGHHQGEVGVLADRNCAVWSGALHERQGGGLAICVCERVRKQAFNGVNGTREGVFCRLPIYLQGCDEVPGCLRQLDRIARAAAQGLEFARIFDPVVLGVIVGIAGFQKPADIVVVGKGQNSFAVLGACEAAAAEFNGALVEPDAEPVARAAVRCRACEAAAAYCRYAAGKESGVGGGGIGAGANARPAGDGQLTSGLIYAVGGAAAGGVSDYAGASADVCDDAVFYLHAHCVAAAVYCDGGVAVHVKAGFLSQIDTDVAGGNETVRKADVAALGVDAAIAAVDVGAAGEQERAKTALGENLENVFVVHGAPPSSVQCLLKFIVRYCF